MEKKSDHPGNTYYDEWLRERVEEFQAKNRKPGDRVLSEDEKSEIRNHTNQNRRLPQHAFFGVQSVGNQKYWRLRPKAPDSVEHLCVYLYSDSISQEQKYRPLAEIEREFFDRLRALFCSEESPYEPFVWDGFDELNPRTLLIQINRASSKIATTTRRGRGNILIVSYYALELMKRSLATCISDEETDTKDIHAGSILKYVGLYNNNIKVYVNPEWSNDHPILIGYRGNIFFDAGAFLIQHDDGYCLKIPKETDESVFVDWRHYYHMIRVST